MIRVCVVGFGRIGREHVGWIQASNEAVVGCVVDTTDACRQIAASRGIKAFETLKEARGDQAFDAVLVSVPTAFHFDLAKQALEMGLHVMVEKPVTLDLDSALELDRLSKKNGKVLSVFHNRRWDPDFLTLRHALQNGVLGKIFNVESRLTQYASCVGPAAPEYRPNWRNEKAFGGGGLLDWGSHFIDQLHLLLEPARPTQVFAQLRGHVWSRDCDDFARVAINFDSGACALLEINTITTRPMPRWRVDAEKGSVDSPHSDEFDTHVWAQHLLTPADGSGNRMLGPVVTGLTESQIWQAFARACQRNGQPAVSMDSVLMTMRLLDAARESSRSGKAVEIG